MKLVLGGEGTRTGARSFFTTAVIISAGLLAMGPAVMLLPLLALIGGAIYLSRKLSGAQAPQVCAMPCGHMYPRSFLFPVLGAATQVQHQGRAGWSIKSTAK